MNGDSRRSRLLLALLLITAVTLITLDYGARDGSPLGPVRSVAGAVFGPVERAVAAVTRPVGAALSSLAHPGRSTAELDRLRQQNAALRLQLQRNSYQAARAGQLAGLLRLTNAGQYTLVPAQVVAIGAGLGFEWTATIDVGSRDGVRPDMTVVNGAGLVGRVKTVTVDTATVLLAIDPTFHSGARLERSAEIGYTTGQGLLPMTLTLASAQAVLRRGDRLVTQPAGAPFAAGVPIGTVSLVLNAAGALTRTALVTPFVDFTALDLVGVVVVTPRTDPRDRLLPAAPRVHPSSRAVLPGPASSPTPTGLR